MPGPMPKSAATRQRRNKVTTAATLVADPTLVAPDLPEREWHPLTVAWWRDVWASPMAPEYDDSDRHGLVMLAAVVDDFWRAEKPRERQAAAAEIRQQSQRFGLSPIDRRRLQWEIERTDAAVEQGQRRRERRKPTEGPVDDPRAALRAV